MKTGLIILKELYQNSRIEPSFIVLLEKEGLISTTLLEGEKYIEEAELMNLQRFANLYYELSINIEGIDVIHNLLHKIDDMEKELYQLRKVLNYHKSLWESDED